MFDKCKDCLTFTVVMAVNDVAVGEDCFPGRVCGRVMLAACSVCALML